MSNLTDMAAVPIEVKIGDKVYTVSPMTLGDWSEADRWAEEQWLAGMKRRLEAFKEQPEVVKQLSARIATIKKYELQIEAASYLDFGEGTAHLLYYQLRHKHPKMTVEEAQKLVTQKQFYQIQRRLAGVGVTEEPKKEKAES